MAGKEGGWIDDHFNFERTRDTKAEGKAGGDTVKEDVRVKEHTSEKQRKRKQEGA